ncbi:hypothetical protein Aperf_G00000006336 [Anoplocephala perfoliata]
MTSVVSTGSASTSSTAVNLRRDQTSSRSFRRPPAVRSLVLSEMFLPLENTSLTQSSRSRSACRSCLLVEPTSQEQISLSPTVCQVGKKNASSTLQRSDSLLSRLQSLFVIKRPVGSHFKSKKSPAPPKIQPPLLNYDSFFAQLRTRSQSAVSRNHHHFLKATSAQASPARSITNEPLVCNTPSPQVTTHTPLTSFVPSPTKVQRPQNFPLVQRRQRCNNSSQQKHLSAHLPGEQTVPSQASSGAFISMSFLHPFNDDPSLGALASIWHAMFLQSLCGLWSASSVTSLGVLPQRSAVSSERTATKMPALVGSEIRSFLRFRRRSPSSSSSSNDSAVDLHPSAAASIESDRKQYQNHTANNSSLSTRIYEEVPSTATLNLSEKTPTAAQPQNFVRSVSTTTLTSVETERVEEPTYAVPLSNTTAFSGPLQPPAPPPVPPKSGICRLEMEDPSLGTMPPALTASPQPPIYVEKTVPQRRAASALRVSYQRSPRFYDSTRGRRPASTVSPSDLMNIASNATNTITSSSGSSWYADILPYNPSNLPDTLADRLKQRNSFILSAPSAPQGDDLMTRSLFESRQPSESYAWLHPSRSVSRTRPVSFHDAPSISINLPSLDHLLKPSETKKVSAPNNEVTASPLKELFLQEPLQVQPSDSPLLGQYCRLKLVIPPAATSEASTSTLSTSRSAAAAADVCSTFMQSSRF